MKKLLYFLLLLPLTFVAASCDDDNDVPDVDITTTVSGDGVVVNNRTIYAVPGDTISLDFTMKNHSGKEGNLGVINLYLDRVMIAQVLPGEPFKFSTEGMPVGRHLLQASMPVFVVDYPICWGYSDYVIQLVDNRSDIPTDDGTGTTSATVKSK